MMLYSHLYICMRYVGVSGVDMGVVSCLQRRYLTPGAILDVILDAVHYACKMDLDILGMYKGHM